ncbi:restriction endonuclease subunit S [Bradyrhizobium manausense]|uniref:restriction endonuclease subunit S n=1 Tax=Bradyrhizobium manausense TaxID=989370 RepID=UPI001BA7D68D|nr:restriction endonuclease subunit S [Bradyrhizobium manausense]MBR0789883.1 restriction endonuclease subunit S [Bradyrhizobium manausense]
MTADEPSQLVPKLRFPNFRDEPQWEVAALGDFATFTSGGTPSIDIPEYWNGHIPWISAASMYDMNIYDSDRKVTTLAIGNGTRIAKAGSLLILTRGSMLYNRVPIGIASIDVAFNQDVRALTIDPTVDTSFLMRQLTSQESRIPINDTGIGAGKIDTDDLRRLPIAFPSLAEQQKIADCLSSLDDMIAAEVRKLKALRQHKQGLMQQLFPLPGETVPRLRFPEFRNVGEWKEEKLDNLARRGTGHTPNKAKAEYYNGGIKWVSLADSKRLDGGLISETAIEISETGIKNSSAVLHPAGSVVLSRDAGVGKSAVISCDMAVSQHFIVWTCDPVMLSNWFLYYQLQLLKPLFEQVATGSTIKTIGLPFFDAMQITIPRLSEQKKIAACLSSLDEMLAAQSQKVKGLTTHKHGLLQQLFPPLEASES